MPRGSRDDRWRYTGVDRKTLSAITENNGAIDHNGVANNHVVLAPRQDQRSKTESQKIARPQKGPIVRILAILDNNFVRRQRRPADIFRAPAPVDPCRTPFISPHPDPAEVTIEDPATIMISNPAPIVFISIGDPIPAPLVGINPMPIEVGAPIAGHSVRNPNLAPAWMLLPPSIRFQDFAEFD